MKILEDSFDEEKYFAHINKSSKASVIASS
jgi:hypothetical protein